jgi:hypothetical protein
MTQNCIYWIMKSKFYRFLWGSCDIIKGETRSLLRSSLFVLPGCAVCMHYERTVRGQNTMYLHSSWSYLTPEQNSRLWVWTPCWLWRWWRPDSAEMGQEFPPSRTPRQRLSRFRPGELYINEMTWYKISRIFVWMKYNIYSYLFRELISKPAD